MDIDGQFAPLRVAFIGCGGYAINLVTAGCESNLIEPVVCFDVSHDNARQYSEQFGFDYVTSYEDVLNDPQVEAVIIATPNYAHRDNAMAAATAGKHVFVEKPIANDISDAEDIIAHCHEHGVVLAVGHNGRFHAAHRKIKAMLDEGVLGSPMGVEANFSHNGGLALERDHWRWHRDNCPALPMMQLGIHFVDTIHYLLGYTEEVYSYAKRSVIKAENDDSVVCMMKLETGPLAYVGSYYACPRSYYVIIHGTEGSVYCNDGSVLYRTIAGNRNYETVMTERRNTQLSELEDFARAIRTGTKPEVDGETALQALAVVRASIESADLRRPVRIDEFLRVPQASTLSSFDTPRF